MRWLRRFVYALALLVLLLASGIYYCLHGSLARYDGEVQIGVSAPAVLTRDERGYLNIEAANRLDAARALGYAHAQERFFQMDLLRRNSAGELSALVGAKALPLDERRRINRFRHRAELAFAAMPDAHRKLLIAYAEGVNEGLSQLRVRPFEYLVLRQTPKPWLPEETLLANYSMYLDLQESQGRDDLAMGVLKDAVSEDWYKFITQHSATYGAAIDGSEIPAVPVPDSPSPFATIKTACNDCDAMDSRDIGSNNFAVAGTITPHGGAILADDMHLSVTVPGIWYKARLSWMEGKEQHHVAGVSLPGVPAIVAGSNGSVAWGFTNSTGDWADTIALKFSADGKQYLTPEGPKPFVIAHERIDVAGGQPVDFEVKETVWGPVMAAPFDRYALRWVALDPQGANMRLFGMEHATNLAEALRVGAGAGIPAQNLVVADSAGHIGWTIGGAIPRKHVSDPNVPQDWSTGENRWDGYLGADEQPQVVDPADSRLWTANARVVGGEALAVIGNGGYDLGARAQQIRDDLRAKPKLGEADLHAIQMDNRAVMMQRWKHLLLDEVLTPQFVAANNLVEYRHYVETTTDTAGMDQVGYTLVRAFRLRTLQQIFAPLAAMLEAKQLKLSDLKFMQETPGWALIQAKRPDTLPPGANSWNALLEDAVLHSRDEVVKKAGTLAQAGWAQQNIAHIVHPLSSALPFLSRWLDMPKSPLSGDSNMPKVALAVHGQSERMVVSPGHEDLGILVIPSGQSGNPISPYYAADHQNYLDGVPTPFLPGPAQHRLVLMP